MTKSLPKLVGETLRAARKATRLTADQLIERAGVPKLTRSLVSRYETGAVLPAHERLTVLLRACGQEVPAVVTEAYRAAAQDPAMAQVRPAGDLAEFVRAWQQAASVRAVAESLGLTCRQASIRAGWLRQKGVPLKRMPTRPRHDWDALRTLAESLSPPKERP